MNDKYLRQRGLVDQEKVANLKILVSGSSGGVSDLVVLLSQLGIGQQTGGISILIPSQQPDSVFWKLAFPEAKQWSDWERMDPTHRMAIASQESVKKNLFDYHLCLNPTETMENVNLYGYAHGPRAKVSRNPLSQTISNKEHVLTPAMRVVVAATMLQQMLNDVECLSKLKISDAWFTVTCRVESTNFEEVREYITGIDGTLVDVQLSSDGNATLARYRPLQQPDLNSFDFLSRTMNCSQPELSVSSDIGFVGWNETACLLDTSWTLSGNEVVVLGAGGLGSWSSPLLAQQMTEGALHVVDGDPVIELHNLNRQVLYNEQHLGSIKATTASQRLQEINGNNRIEHHFEYLNPHHLNFGNLDESDEEFDDLGIEPSQLFSALKNSSIYLACLDNMVARTILNEAAIQNGKLMINGATEALHGVVETFGQEGCMVCRYGNDAARSTEVISCTEEGVRPIASIVTSTAWVGAMMALLAMMNLHPSEDFQNFRSSWYEGEIESSSPTKPPWFNELCKYHI
jgi:molybdopterin-synthase adenylyltransferase